MKKDNQSETKFSVVYPGTETTATWTYDLDKYKFGPISVSVEYHDDLENPKKKAKKKK